MQIIKLTVPGTLPSMNEVIAKSKNFGNYNKIKQKYTQLVVEQSKGLPAIESADFLFEWYCENKRKDPDNIAGGGTKAILDGLVEAGVLPNDGWKQVKRIDHRFHIDKENPRIEVTIFEV